MKPIWRIILILLIIGLVIAAGFAFFKQKDYSQITNFDECAAAGYPIMESYPEQCRTPDGRTFRRDTSKDLENLIRVISPRANELVRSPLTISGEARGNWYFEASFPIKLLDANGNVMVQAPAQAQGEWMTTEFVPFTLTLTFSSPITETGTLVLEKDNPSGLLENANELRIPVRFRQTTVQTGSGISGYIHTGPTCPVERMPPDPACADRPYADAFISAREKISGKTFSTRSDAGGNFRIAAPAGSYVVSVDPVNILPRCETTDVMVKAEQFVAIDISCDSGIR